MKLTMPRFDRSGSWWWAMWMLRRYWHGPTPRIHLKTGAVVKVEQKRTVRGALATGRADIAALGAPAWLVGVTGDDEAGREVPQASV